MTAVEFRPEPRGWRASSAGAAPVEGAARAGRYVAFPAAVSAALLVALSQHGWWAVTATAVVLVVVAVAAGPIRAAYRAGRAVERARWLRLVHDTALQSLEAMALATDADRNSPAEVLTGVRAAARREAAALRGNLAQLTAAGGGPGAGSLVRALNDMVAALPAGSPDVEVVGGEPAPMLTNASRDVLRDATRAALGNAVRHAAANRVVVRVAGSGAGVAVVIRDDGRGFDPGRMAPGFGIQQSITARLREAGGTATVESTPGRGTRVRLWVPASASTGHLR